MEDQQEKTVERMGKIKLWLKNPSNLALVGVLALAFLIRLYFFVKTCNQPLWWDEADYMNMARKFAFGGSYPLDPVRPILFSLIAALFLKFTASEFIPRAFMMLLSLASVVGVYYLGKEVYSKKVGLIAGFFMSLFYLNLFFSTRLLVDLPSLTFYIFSAYFFYKYVKEKSNKFLYLSALIAGIGTLFRITTALVLVAFFVYLVVVERLQFLKKKELWISLLIFLVILAPYLIWGYYEFHGFVITQASAVNAPSNYLANFFSVLWGYLSLFPGYLSWVFLIVFVMGILSMYELIIGLDVISKNDNLKKNLYIFLLFLVPLLLSSFMINHNEDRYILNAFPAIFIIAGSFILLVYKKIKPYSKIIAGALLISLLIYFAFSQMQQSNSLIDSKKTSYLQVQEAGEWLKQNSLKDSVIMTRSVPQIEYYSDRRAIGISENRSKFDEDLEKYKPDYIMISLFESHPKWVYTWPNENNTRAIQAYFSDSDKTKPVLIIYEIKQNGL